MVTSIRAPLAIVAATFVLVAGDAMGQERTATIAGTVKDVAGGVLPGVVVIVTDSGGATIETLSDGAGGYRVGALEPGRYELVARLSGFDAARVVDIDLAIGVQLSIDLALRPSGPNETVEVVSESPRLAITQAARATTLSRDLLERLPRGVDFMSLAVHAPGANNERKLGGLSIDGSSGGENRIMIDGTEVTDTWTGAPGQFLATDFVDEVQVKSSGYTAEYGGSTGGVVNVVTKSGTNLWRGRALLWWSGHRLDAAPPPTLQLVPADPTRAEYVRYAEDHYTQSEPGFTVSGPLVRDRVWFFSGYAPALRDVTRTVTFQGTAIPQTFTQRLDRHHAAANVTTRVGARWRTRGAFSSGRQIQGGLLPPQDGTGNPRANYAVDEFVPNYSASATVDYMATSRAYFSIRSGYFLKNTFTERVYEGDRYFYQSSSLTLDDVPATYKQPRGFANVPTIARKDRERSPHFSLEVDGTTAFTARGQHELRGGMQFDRVGIDVLSGATGNMINVFWGLPYAGVQGPYGYYIIGSNDLFPNRGTITHGDRAVNNLALFLQDAWRVGNRLTLHLGIRTEDESVPSLSNDPRIPATALHFGFVDKLAPRLGFAWDATGDRKTKIYGSWGVFYDITKLQISIGFGGVRSQAYYYTLDSGDIGAILDNPDCPPTCPGTLIRGPVSFTVPLNDPNDDRIDPDLAQMRLQEMVAGIEREITSRLSVSARYVHKQLDRVIEDVGTQLPGQSTMFVRIANPGFGTAALFYPGGGSTAVAIPPAKRDYDAIELALDRRLSTRWSARAAYTWSRLFGNYSGLAQSDEDGRFAPNSGLAFDYPMRSFDETGTPVYGVLATDRPHQLKLNGLYQWPFGTSVGLFWSGSSGIPRTREAAFAPGFPVMYRGRNSDGRLPFLTQLDVHVRHELPIGQRYRWTLSANVSNVFNQRNITNYFPYELYAGQFITVDEVAFHDGINTQRLIAEQRLARDARFLQSSGFQAPRSMRVGVVFAF